MKYRKKPIVIEALQLKNDDYSIFNVLKFIGEVNVSDAFNPLYIDALNNYIDKIKVEGLMISTLEGEIHASIDDYIIKGIKGEFYPCKSDIFEETYELI